jgi:hypothetical protein
MNRKWIVMALVAGMVVFAAGCAGTRGHDRMTRHMMPMMSGPLDGMTFEGQVGMMGDTKGEMDILTFKNGYFHSSACDQYHFGSGPYLAVTSDGTTTFQARTWNLHGATILWNGTVKGKMLEGNMTLYERGKEPMKQWVKATMK